MNDDCRRMHQSPGFESVLGAMRSVAGLLGQLGIGFAFAAIVGCGDAKNATTAVDVTSDQDAVLARPASKTRPSIVLIHGAWADGTSWSSVISFLQDNRFTVVAPAVGLGSLSADVAAIHKVISHLAVPVLVVGHSYGEAVVTGAASGLSNVKGNSP